MSKERKDDLVMDQSDPSDRDEATNPASDPSEESGPTIRATEAAAGTADEPIEVDAAESGPPSPEELKSLREKAAKSDEHWDRMLRLTADFDNFKKRSARERQEAIRYSNESLLERLLPTLDHFEMALAAAKQTDTATLENLLQGIEMVQSQLKTVLTEAGMEEIDAVGRPFDPNWHEAVSQQESADHNEGDVIQQVRKGYKLRDRLLRPASVIVAKPAAS